MLIQGAATQGVKGRFTSIMVGVIGEGFRPRRAFEMASQARNICCMPAYMNENPSTSVPKYQVCVSHGQEARAYIDIFSTSSTCKCWCCIHPTGVRTTNTIRTQYIIVDATV